MTRALLAALVLWGGTALPAAAADGKGDYYRNGHLDRLMRGSAFTFPTSLTPRLYSVCPTASTAGTELSGNGYTPPSITSNTSNWTASSSGAVSNAVDISFGTASAQWTAAACVGVTDGANMVMFGDLAAPTTVRAGERAHFPAGSLTFTEDPAAAGGIALVQHNECAPAANNNGGTGQYACTFSSPTTAGNFILVMAHTDSSNTTGSWTAGSVTDGSNTYRANASAEYLSGGRPMLKAWWVENAASVSTVTVAGVQAFYGVEVSITEWSGILSSEDPFDQYGAGGGYDTLTYSLAGATTQADEIVVALVAQEASGAVTFTAVAPWTQLGSPGGVQYAAWEYRIVSSTGTYSSDWTSSGTQNNWHLLTTFKGQ